MKFILSFAAVLSLTACAVVETAAVDTGRETARAVVGPIVADTVPGPAGTVLTNCIIDNASGAELATIAAGGGTPANVTLVGDILARDATIACATAGLT